MYDGGARSRIGACLTDRAPPRTNWGADLLAGDIVMTPMFPSPFWFISPATAPCAGCDGMGLVWHANVRTPEECLACLGTGKRPRSTTPRVAVLAARLSIVVIACIVMLTVF